MTKLITLAALEGRFSARYPSAGVIDSISASKDGGSLETVEASAFRPFSSPGGKTVVLKAVEPFFVAGEVIPVGDLVQVLERDAAYIVSINRAAYATDAEIAAAKEAA